MVECIQESRGESNDTSLVNILACFRKLLLFWCDNERLLENTW